METFHTQTKKCAPSETVQLAHSSSLRELCTH